MQITVKRWASQHLATLYDWLVGSASVLIAAAVVYYWFMPVGTSCTTTMQSVTTCQSVSLANSGGMASLAITPLVIAIGLAFGWLFFHFRRTRMLLVGFGVVAIAFYVLSFGIDAPFLPAALVSLVAAVVPTAPRAPS